MDTSDHYVSSSMIIEAVENFVANNLYQNIYSFHVMPDRECDDEYELVFEYMLTLFGRYEEGQIIHDDSEIIIIIAEIDHRHCVPDSLHYTIEEEENKSCVRYRYRERRYPNADKGTLDYEIYDYDLNPYIENGLVHKILPFDYVMKKCESLEVRTTSMRI